MRNLIVLFVLLITTVGFGQKDFNPWSIGGEFGSHHVADESAELTDIYNHYGLNVRYNFTPTVGVALYGRHDNLTMKNFEGVNVEGDLNRLNVEAVLDVFDLLDLNLLTDKFTLLMHGGPGTTFIRTEGYNDDVFNLTGGLTGLVRITKRLSATLDISVTGNYTHSRTLDGYAPTTNAGLTSMISNTSVGLNYALPFGKHKDKTPADYYVRPPEVKEVIIREIIREPQITEVTKVEYKPCDCKVQEYVFFEHDKDVILQSELNAINQVYEYMKANPDSEVTISGYASDTKSSAEYNMELSARRVDAVAQYLVDMGIDSTRINEDPEGKDYSREERVHDTARRVELRVN